MDLHRSLPGQVSNGISFALRCSTTAVENVGYPSNCGVVYGTFGDPVAHQERLLLNVE